MKQQLFLYAAVAVGGAVGTLVRLMAAGNLLTYLLVPNLLACLLMGMSCCLLSRFKLPELYRRGVNAGFLGGLSTYAAPVLVHLVDGAVTFVSFVGVICELLAYLGVSALGWWLAAWLLSLRQRCTRL